MSARLGKLWRKELQRVHEQLSHLDGRVGGLLVEVSPEWYEFRPPPGMEMGNCPWGTGWIYNQQTCEWRSGHGEAVRESRPLLDAQGRPMIGSRTFQDVECRPMLLSNGQPVAFDLGLRRYHFIFGDIPTANKLIALAQSAGAALRGAVLPQGEFAPGAMYSHQNDLRWFYMLHEIGWKCYPGTSLSAKRMTWYVTTNGSPVIFPADQLHSFRKDRFPEGLAATVNQNIPDPPAHTYSELPNLITASMSGIDVLLSMAEESAPEVP